MFDNQEEHPLTFSVPSLDLPGEVLHAGQWHPATILSVPNDHPDPQQRLSGWKVQVHVGEGIFKYVWNPEEVRIE